MLSTYGYIINSIYSHKNFSISGIWLANFNSYEKGKHNYELVRIIQNQEIFRLYIEHYTNTTGHVRKLLGNGIFRGSKFASIYYSLDKSDIRNGVFLLRTIFSPSEPTYLLGKYAEFESTENGETLHISREDYVLNRITLPIVKSIKMKLHIQCFRNYADINTYYHEKNLKTIL